MKQKRNADRNDWIQTRQRDEDGDGRRLFLLCGRFASFLLAVFISRRVRGVLFVCVVCRGFCLPSFCRVRRRFSFLRESKSIGLKGRFGRVFTHFLFVMHGVRRRGPRFFIYLISLPLPSGSGWLAFLSLSLSVAGFWSFGFRIVGDLAGDDCHRRWPYLPM